MHLKLDSSGTYRRWRRRPRSRAGARRHRRAVGGGQRPRGVRRGLCDAGRRLPERAADQSAGARASGLGRSLCRAHAVRGQNRGAADARRRKLLAARRRKPARRRAAARRAVRLHPRRDGLERRTGGARHARRRRDPRVLALLQRRRRRECAACAAFRRASDRAWRAAAAGKADAVGRLLARRAGERRAAQCHRHLLPCAGRGRRYRCDRCAADRAAGAGTQCGVPVRHQPEG